MTTILKIARLGESILQQKASPIELDQLDDYQSLITDMITTLESLEGRVGIAAPQVFVSKRLFVYRIPKTIHSRYQTSGFREIPLTVVINPEYTLLNDQKDLGWEACLSVPGLMGQVSRHRAIRLSYWDRNGTKQEDILEGFPARVVQHECDHLDGLIYPMRMDDISSLGFEEEIVNRLKSSI